VVHMQWHAVSTKDVDTSSKLDLEIFVYLSCSSVSCKYWWKLFIFFYTIWHVFVISNQIMEFQETFQLWNVLHKQRRLYYTFLHNWVFTGKWRQYENFKNQSACPSCFKSLYMYIHTLSEYYNLSYILYI
jgi:hypothetical protein